MSISNNTYAISGSHHAAGSWLSQVSARMHHWREVWAQRRARAREMRELNRCSDRELWDMGLSRSDLLSIEAGVYRRD
jgi:uncharacterized protein YjiS (DUF1127 family)